MTPIMHTAQFTHPSNARLLGEAVRRGLDFERLGDRQFAVSSFSRPGEWYAVEVGTHGYTCTCAAAEACSHGSLAASVVYPVTCGLRWDFELIEEFYELRRRMYAGEMSPQWMARRRSERRRRLAESGKGSAADTSGHRPGSDHADDEVVVTTCPF